jgi:hypothetical protein
MGLFGTRKKAQNFASSDLKPVSKPMNENTFWDIIEDGTINQVEQTNQINQKLNKLSLEELVGFRLRIDKLLSDSYNEKLWCAGYIMNGGCSDDGFEFFRLWIISKGKSIFYSVLNNPDSLEEIKINEDEELEFENLWNLADNIFKEKTSQELDDFIDDSFMFGEGNYPNIDFSWSEEVPETMRVVCPKLFEKYW